MRYSLAFHIVGLVMWLGGLMIITRCMRVFCLQLPAEAQVGVDSLRSIIKRILFGFIIPGCLISVVTGTYQLVATGMSVYMQQGWFHAKLTMVLILLAVTVIVAKEVFRAAKGEILKKQKLIALHAISASSLMIIVFLTVLGR